MTTKQVTELKDEEMKKLFVKDMQYILSKVPSDNWKVELESDRSFNNSMTLELRRINAARL